MKLEKFYAKSMAQALILVQKKLGTEAVIYAQNKTSDGVEIIAGLATQNQPVLEETWLDRLDIYDNQSAMAEINRLEKINLLQQKLKQLRFPYDFIDAITQTYAAECELESIINNEIIIKLLLAKIKIDETELIDSKRICALIGPTGIGKSTTVAKLARRYAAKYGAKNIGIISTDFQRIITKNQFHYFGKLLDIQIEYAKTAVELRNAIYLLNDKAFILIDTAGVSQNDNKKLAELFERLSHEMTDLTSYLVMPCNLQSDILNDVVTQFKMPHTAGCIMTKKDESKSIATCLSVMMMHQLPIAYCCDGQNIVQDIHVPTKVELIKAVFKGETQNGCAVLPA